MTSPVSIDRLAAAADELLVRIDGDPSTTVTGVAYDSRAVGPGDLFFCVPGAVSDGHDWAPTAVAAGAAALCVERPTGAGGPEIVVTDARRAMALVGAEAYGRPADRLTLLGVTGTNGKTTTAFMLERILAADGRTTGLIGTIETRIAGERRAGVRTTPESLDLQRLFADMVDSGVDSVAMEVTSHALALHRVEGLRFASAAFTNLSQDHLDFHADMEDYFEAKRSLFTPERSIKGATNVDDPYGRRLLENAGVPVIGFGAAAGADVRAEDVDLGPSSTTFTLVTPAGSRSVRIALAGHFNVSNALAAAAAGHQAGIELDAIAEGLETLGAVPGRFESVDAGQPFSVLVDYAHTPDSLDNVLRAARPLARAGGGRVICLFGCGGDRDRGKRPLMGAVAARLADYVIVTSDNPRSEDPEAIIGEILEGVLAERPDGPDVVTPDRAAAIGAGLEVAQSGDVFVIAGKGHEQGQQFADRTIDFDDRVVAREGLAGLGWMEAAG
ncbi:MAG TPA: UDP-N-acetylmuramoyl-L-alanyl-D-glutamate--2,6-diaminopimelate ligase [Actinomycetota bacterium]